MPLAHARNPPTLRRIAGRTLAHLVRTDGPVGMYRGVGPPIAMMVLMNGVNFPAFYHFKRVVGGPQGLHDSSREVGRGTTHGSVDPTVILAGALVGPICAIVGTPFELVKLQMQLDGGGDGMRAKRAYKNSAECARTLWRKYGPRVFYLGYGVNTVRECVFNGVFFSTFEHINHGIRRDVLGAGSDSVAVALAGGVAGTVGWFANLPLDCVKSGIQGQRLGSPAPGEWRVRNYAKVGFLEAAAEVRASRCATRWRSSASSVLHEAPRPEARACCKVQSQPGHATGALTRCTPAAHLALGGTTCLTLLA